MYRVLWFIRMRRIEELCEEAKRHGIEIAEETIPISNMDAVYINTDYGRLIVLRVDGTTNEKTCWLAEELGHHHTGQNQVLRQEP